MFGGPAAVATCVADLRPWRRAVIILVGNKTDLAEQREVSAEEGQEYAAQCAPPTPNPAQRVGPHTTKQRAWAHPHAEPSSASQPAHHQVASLGAPPR